MSGVLTVYGAGDLKDALQSIGASARQLTYLVETGAVVPSVRVSGRLGYTRDDLRVVYLMLGPLASLEPKVRSRVAGSAICRVFGSDERFNEEDAPGDDFEEFDLDDSNKNRCPSVKIKVDRQEIKYGFSRFMELATSESK